MGAKERLTRARVKGGQRELHLMVIVKEKKGPSNDSKTPYKYFNSGSGYCKWGDNCRHSHDKKKDGKRKGQPVLLERYMIHSYIIL